MHIKANYMVGGDQSQFKLNSILKDIQKYQLEYVEFTETIACLTESPDNSQCTLAPPFYANNVQTNKNTRDDDLTIY